MDKNFLLNNIKLIDKKRNKVIKMLKFYETNLHRIIMRNVKRELKNLGIYTDFMREVRAQFSKKNEVMVDKDNMTYGSFMIHTEIVDDVSEMSSYSHDINIFIKKSGLTKRSRMNSRRKIRKTKVYFEKFVPGKLKNRHEYGKNKSNSPKRKNYFDDNRKKLIKQESQYIYEEFSVTSLRSKSKKKSKLFEKLKPRGNSVDNKEPEMERKKEAERKSKVNLFDLLNCEKKKKSSESQDFFGSNIGKNIRSSAYNSIKVNAFASFSAKKDF